MRTTTATIQFIAQSATHPCIFVITTSMDEYDIKKKQNLFVRSGKSEAKVTNNRRLLSTYCTIEATDRHEASRGLSATAGLFVTNMRTINYKAS